MENIIKDKFLQYLFSFGILILMIAVFCAIKVIIGAFKRKRGVFEYSTSSDINDFTTVFFWIGIVIMFLLALTGVLIMINNIIF